MTRFGAFTTLELERINAWAGCAQANFGLAADEEALANEVLAEIEQRGRAGDG